MSLRQAIPAAGVPLVDDNGKITSPWFRFFQTLANAPAAAQVVTVGASPLAYTANSSGVIVITAPSGLSTASVSRGTISSTLPLTTQSIAIGQGDILTITYAVAPTVKFYPS